MVHTFCLFMIVTMVHLVQTCISYRSYNEFTMLICGESVTLIKTFSIKIIINVANPIKHSIQGN